MVVQVRMMGHVILMWPFNEIKMIMTKKSRPYGRYAMKLKRVEDTPDFNQTFWHMSSGDDNL